jgi:anti-sigma regulatory factor (Ser/Thr protein kinase)
MIEAGAHPLGVAPSDHVVQIYRSDPDLFAEVGRVVSAALAAGEVALLIASRPHLEGFEGELRVLGVDVDAAQESGRIILCDAVSLMKEFVAAGQVDAAAFAAVVGPVVRRQLDAGYGVTIYGEIVALLWDSGHVMAAIELESMWNDLGRTMPFSLLCAYHADSVLGAEHTGALAQVCGLHSHVLEGPTRRDREDRILPGAQVSAQFPADVAAPRAARRFVVDAMRQWGFSSDLLDDAALVATELAANAVLHAASAFSVVVRAENTAVRIAVADNQPVDQARLVVRPGRGLGLVAGLSRQWGAEISSDGKVVWAELSEPQGD